MRCCDGNGAHLKCYLGNIHDSVVPTNHVLVPVHVSVRGTMYATKTNSAVALNTKQQLQQHHQASGPRRSTTRSFVALWPLPHPSPKNQLLSQSSLALCVPIYWWVFVLVIGCHCSTRTLEHCPKARTPKHGMPWNGRAQRSRRGSASMTTVFGCVSCRRKLDHRNSQMPHHLPSSCMAMVSIAHCIYDGFVSTSIWQETTLSNLGWSNPITSWCTFWNLCIGLHWSYRES